MKRHRSMRLTVLVVAAHVVVVIVVIVLPSWRKLPKQSPRSMEFEFTVVQPARAAVVPELTEVAKAPEPRAPEPVPRRRPGIRTGKRIQRPTDAPPAAVRPPSEAQIRKMLALKTDDPRRRPAAPDDDRAFAALVRDTMYRAWVQPTGGAPDGLVARVSIRVSGAGTVVDATITRSSGNATMDESVRMALRAVKQIPGLSAEFVRRNPSLTIDFELAADN